MERYEHGECGCEHVCAVIFASCKLLGAEGEQIIFKDGKDRVG